MNNKWGNMWKSAILLNKAFKSPALVLNTVFNILRVNYATARKVQVKTRPKSLTIRIFDLSPLIVHESKITGLL